MNSSFDNKVILITGASTGIGRALAKVLAKANCSLALIARRGDLLQELAGELYQSNKNVKTYSCDVAVTDDVKKTIADIRKHFGKIDIAVLNAAVGYKTSVDEFETEKVKNLFDINFFGILNVVNEIVPDFIKRKGGVIVGVSSLADSRGWKGSGFYCASKAAVTVLLDNLRLELRPYNVKVLTVKPGFVETPMTSKNEFKMPFLMNPEKAAKIIAKGISKNKRIIQFPFPMVLSYKFSRIVPDTLIEYFSRNKS
ncbi:MAG: SDR family NAD(P)-dependent oxidoreductase [Ignavibacteria bacterium]